MSMRKITYGIFLPGKHALGEGNSHGEARANSWFAVKSNTTPQLPYDVLANWKPEACTLPRRLGCIKQFKDLLLIFHRYPDPVIIKTYLHV